MTIDFGEDFRRLTRISAGDLGDAAVGGPGASSLRSPEPATQSPPSVTPPIAEDEGTLVTVLRGKLGSAEEALVRLQDDLRRERLAAAKYQTWCDSLIAICPLTFREHVQSRLDATGSSYLADGLWNYIVARTTGAEQRRFTTEAWFWRLARAIPDAAERWAQHAELPAEFKAIDEMYALVAQAIEAEGGDPKGLRAEPAEPDPAGGAPNPSSPSSDSVQKQGLDR